MIKGVYVVSRILGFYGEAYNDHEVLGIFSSLDEANKYVMSKIGKRFQVDESDKESIGHTYDSVISVGIMEHYELEYHVLNEGY